MLDAALRREESRGGHYRSDFPERDDRHPDEERDCTASGEKCRHPEPGADARDAQ
ncbi:MAG: hypothetical protein ABL886_01395 [Rhodoglobus sp.]